jgi:hypothetical protein
MDGWSRWVDVKAVLSIAYSNERELERDREIELLEGRNERKI